MKIVFISYVRENSRKVKRLYDALIRHGVKVWLDRKDIDPGNRWSDTIRKAIQEENSLFLACFSKEYFNKNKTYMNEELTLAIEELRQRPHDQSWFIPIKLNKCQIPDRQIGGGETLRCLQYADLYEDWDDGIKCLLNLIKPNPYKLDNLPKPDFIFGDSTDMNYLYQSASKIADHHSMPITITGKVGTGKTLLSNWIHEKGIKITQKLVEIDCSIPRDELVKKCIKSDNSTILFDRLEKLTRDNQFTLFQYLAGYGLHLNNKDIRARIIFMSRLSTKELIEARRITYDFLARMQFVIDLPPLHRRSGHLNCLINYFWERTNNFMKKDCFLTESARKLMLSHIWPQNVFDLEYTIEHLIHHSSGGAVTKKIVADVLNNY
jgi:hypothetical protein